MIPKTCRAVWVFLLIPLGCSSHKNTSTSPSRPKHETSSTITIGHEDDAVFPVVDNGRFYVNREYQTDEGSKNLTIQEHIITQVRTDRECCEAQVSASGIIDDKPVWTLTKKDDEAEMYDRFYRTVRHGCCGSATRYSYFDPLTGQQAFIATQDLASIDVVSSPNTYSLDRYIALNRISEPGDDLFVLQIQYGPQSGPTQVVFLTYPGQDAAVSDTSMRLVRKAKLAPGQRDVPEYLDLFPPGYPARRTASVQDISGFSISLRVEGFPAINIPVANDHVDFEHTALPKGFRFSNTVPAEDAVYFSQMIQ
jgi:hypothetical protein